MYNMQLHIHVSRVSHTYMSMKLLSLKTYASSPTLEVITISSLKSVLPN